MLKNMPEGMQQIMDRSLRQAMHEGIPKAMQKQEQDRKTSIEVHYYHCDHLGTPRELTDESGKLVWSAEYMAWGKLKRLQGRAGGSADAAGAGVPPDQFWHTRTQPGRSNHLPEWVADNTGNVRRWREAQEAEQPTQSDAANEPNVWGELADQSIRFQGQWHDVETGLHYNRFRYYDPEVGRFIHQDPIGLLGGVNLYQYAPNPISWIDPLGLAGRGANGVVRGPKIPGGEQLGRSKAAGGKGITNPAVQQVYDEVPPEKRSLYHGKCVEGEALSDAANKAGVRTKEELAKITEDATSTVYNAKGRYLPPCSSCKCVLDALNIKAKK